MASITKRITGSSVITTAPGTIEKDVIIKRWEDYVGNGAKATKLN